MKRSRLLVLALIGALLASIAPSTALAHPLGNFTVNRYAGLSVRPDAITVDYVVDMAEIPAYQEIRQQIDTKGAGVTDEAESNAYRRKKCGELVSQLTLTINGQPLTLNGADSALEFPPGAGGLLTLRLTCTFSAALGNPALTSTIEFRDVNFADRIGWREIVVEGDGTTIRNSNVPSASVSNRLRSYPNDLLSSPLQQTQARFEFQPGPIGSNAVSYQTAAGAVDRTKDSFAALITVSDLSLPVMFLSLFLAMGLGALHAVSPGHGKTMMAAYLVGSRGTAAQALLLGLTVTITHTLGVLILGLLTLFASRYILPESLYPWLSLSSGLIVIGMGATLAWNRWRGMHPSYQNSHDIHHHHEHHSHHEHSENAEPHTHSHEDQVAAELAHARSHLPQHLPEEGLKWKDLVALGLVGGLVPSASALIVLLAAISLQRIAFGIVLVIAFGLGMALVLVGTGILLVRAGRFLERRRIAVTTMTWMPLASALVVIGAGLFVTAQATLQMGLWRP